MKEYFKPALAELIGTFILVFIGAGAGATNAGIVGVALAHGIALMVIIYAFGSISGAHVNPAVTISLALTGKVNWVRAVMYLIAQLIGAARAGYVLRFVLSPTSNLGATQLEGILPIR